MGVRRRRIRPAVMHGRAHFDTGRETVEDEPARSLLKNRNQLLMLGQIVLSAVNCGGELAGHLAGGLLEFRGGTTADQQRRRSEQFLLESAVIEERRRISLENDGWRLTGLAGDGR